MIYIYGYLFKKIRLYYKTSLPNNRSVNESSLLSFYISNVIILNQLKTYKKLRGEKMQVKFDLQHFCCGPRGCEIEIEYGVMADAEE